MNYSLSKWGKRWLMVFLILISLLILAWLYPFYDHVLAMIGRVLLPFALALVVSLLLHPLVCFLVQGGIPRTLAILIIFLSFFSSIVFGIYQGYPLLLHQLKSLIEQMPELTQIYQQWTKEFYAQTERFPDGIHQKLDGSFANFEQWLTTRVMAVLTSVKGLFGMVILLALVPVMTFYFLNDYRKIGSWLLRLLPESWHHEAKGLTKKLNHSLGGYIRGQLLVSFVVGILATVGYWLIDLPYPLVLGVIAGITNIIPYFGPLLGAVPALIVAFTLSWQTLLFTVGLIVIIQVAEGNLLSPFIMSKSIHIHPLFIILALLIGGEIGGIPGLILAVPILTCVKVIVTEIKSGRIDIDR